MKLNQPFLPFRISLLLAITTFRPTMYCQDLTTVGMVIYWIYGRIQYCVPSAIIVTKRQLKKNFDVHF